MRVPGELTHAFKWLLFLIPLGGLAIAQTRGLAPDLERSRSFAQGIGGAIDYDQLGQSLLATGDRPAAAESFRAALGARSHSCRRRARDWLTRSRSSVIGQGRRRPIARRSATRTSATARNGLGNLLAVEGRAQDAISEYRRAIELDPELRTARANLGGALASLGQWSEALGATEVGREPVPGVS